MIKIEAVDVDDGARGHRAEPTTIAQIKKAAPKDGLSNGANPTGWIGVIYTGAA